MTASELENNLPGRPQRGIAEIGSALALEVTADPNTGLGDFCFRSYPQYADRLAAWTTCRDGMAELVIRQSADLDAVMLECIADCISQHLYNKGKSILEFARILVAAPLACSMDRIAGVLQTEPDRITTSFNAERVDAFTSGIAMAWADAIQSGRPQSEESWLIVSAGAGIEVGCAEYHFGPKELSQ